MRKITFRAWNLNDKKMFYNTYLCPGNIIVDEDDDMIGHLGKDTHLMQSTGLIDKNGEVIYEGDIVNTVKENGVEVYYKRGNYWAGIYQLLYLGVAGVEVIGNTYETPELINKQKDFYSYLPYYE